VRRQYGEGNWMKIYDVSLLVREGMMVYRGNPKPKIRFVSRIPKGSNNSTLLTLGAHTGTHMDAGLHGANGGWMVSDADLKRLVGNCRVLNLGHVKEGIGEKELRKFKVRKGEIIVLKTRNSVRGFGKFRRDFIHVTLDGAKYLVKHGIAAIAIDSLGIQKSGSGNMKVHNVFLKKRVPIFEGLDLSKVPAGSYFFIGLPVRLKAEAAPARVLLVKGLRQTRTRN